MLTYPLSRVINARGKVLDLTSPKIMAILNVTPDSFYDGGAHFDLQGAVHHAITLWEAGANILDVGAYSSRPGANDISEQEELDRLLPVISSIREEIPESILSVDTFRAKVARAAIEYGADMVNDISGGNLDAAMFQTIGELKVPYVLMHMRGMPDTMQKQTDYEDLMLEITRYFKDNIFALRAAGVRDIILDPGFGFAKTLEQNYRLAKHLDEFKWFGLPILGAVSRKSMIYNALKVTPDEALNGTTVLNTLLLLKGVQLLRVHDVKEAKETLRIIELYTKA